MDGGIGIFRNGGTTPAEALEFQGEPGLLLCNGNLGIPLPMKQWNRPSQVEEGDNGALLELCHETLCSSVVGTCISGIFLRCIKGVLYPFAFQEAMWDSS